MAQLQCPVKLDGAYIEANRECIASQSFPGNIYNPNASGGCPPPQIDKDSTSSPSSRLSDMTLDPGQDAFSSPMPTEFTVPVECDKHEYQTDSDITGEPTYLSSSCGDSPATCSSSPGLKEKLRDEGDHSFSNVLSGKASGDDEHLLPPSSSPLQCSSPVGIMSSPISHSMTMEKEKGENKLTCLQHPMESLCSDGHVTDMDDKPDITRSGKRKRSESLSALDQFEETRNTSTHGNGIPNPKRLTAGFQRLQHEKLKTPFRSPLKIQNKGSEPQVSKSVDDIEALKIGWVKAEASSAKKAVQNVGDIRTKYRTARAATQFKSPLPVDAATKLGKMVRMTPSIQALERRSQILKRALKIKQEDQERMLEELARKWTDAGREVAWELWALVKDNGTSDYGQPNQDKSLQPTNNQGWGWDEPTNEERGRDECPYMSGIETDGAVSNDGCNQAPNAEEEPLKNTLGIMLRRLGIDPETLGWDEGESMFIDN